VLVYCDRSNASSKRGGAHSEPPMNGSLSEVEIGLAWLVASFGPTVGCILEQVAGGARSVG
jgi:hypothetical protein